MAGVSKHVMEAGEWCAPTRELENGQLLKLVHKTRKIVRETIQPLTVEVEAEGDVAILVDNKHPKHEAPRFNVTGTPVYPVMRDRYRGLRIALGTLLIVGSGGVAAFFLLA